MGSNDRSRFGLARVGSLRGRALALSLGHAALKRDSIECTP